MYVFWQLLIAHSLIISEYRNFNFSKHNFFGEDFGRVDQNSGVEM